MNKNLLVNVISTWDPDFWDRTDLVDHPENMDQVNWILNQNYVNRGLYTFGEVQKAIWDLLEDELPESFLWSLGTWSQEKADEIIAASAAGEGYTPGCGDLVAIVLQPIDETEQVILITHPLGCYCDETAWASGEDFGGDSWAMYFKYDVCND